MSAKEGRMDHDMAANEAPSSRTLRLLGLLALAALAIFIAAAWLRAYVPAPRAVRMRDVRWLQAEGRRAA